MSDHPDPSQHPLRPDLAPPQATPADPRLAYQESHAAYPADFNPYASTISNPYLAARPVLSLPDEPYAHWGRRVGASLLDGLLQVPFTIASDVGLGIIHAGTNTGGSVQFGLVVVLVANLGLIAFVVWNQVFRQGRTGASLGKQWLDIRVVSETDGRPIGALWTFVRSLLHLLDILPLMLGYLWPLWDRKRQTFADKIMKTAVLHLPPR